MAFTESVMSSTTTTDAPLLDEPTGVKDSAGSVPKTQPPEVIAKSPSSDGDGLDSKLAKLNLSSEDASAGDAPKGGSTSSEDVAAGLEKMNEKGDEEGTQKGPKKTPTKPYVNPDRFLTGGSPREKLSTEDLEKKIARIRQNNEKIKQRQLTVQADEDAFKATQSADLKKQAQNKKIQEGVNRNREQNAQRKMERMNNREWDSNKKRPERGQGQGHKDKVIAQGQQIASQVKEAEETPATSIS